MVQTTEKLKDVEEAKVKPKPLHRGVIIGSVAVFISVLGAAVTFPFLQSQRDLFQCDAECYGFMQSLRSGLTLVGTIFVGRVSDRFGRRFALWVGVGASMATCVLNYRMTTIQEMWIAMMELKHQPGSITCAAKQQVITPDQLFLCRFQVFLAI